MELPELPPCEIWEPEEAYTPEQMRAYAMEAVRREREACAAMFDDHPHAEMFRREIADAIRARSEQGKD